MKKNETKDTPVSNKKPDGQDNVVEKSKSKSKSEAGKGDKLRRGITQDEWGMRWEKIFGKKERVARKESGSLHSSKDEGREYNEE